MKYPYIQPFKNITVVMKDATNNGMGKVNPNDSFNALRKDHRFHCIVIDDDGTGRLARASDTKGFIGVLSESFNKVGVGHTVITQGIVPIKSTHPIFPEEIGHLVAVSHTADKDGQIEIARSTHHTIVGKVLDSCENEGDYVPVLIGMY